ncbi:MAG: CopG family transcriptional regulator [Verrucomicrobia bacterium]|nr:CopG family transcriptional regulator [Verrucomicrobiota bacterium]MBV9875067.1 CopG family transcriptional regulator [Verrucomicrobiota bacterium]
MRTTLDLDDDILAAARSIAAARKQTMGKVVSDLVRQSLATRIKQTPSGIPLLPRRPGVVVTAELIDRLREEEGL